MEAISSQPFVLDDPEVGAWISEVGDSNVILTFTGWVDQTKTSFPKARGEAIRIAKSALENAGFGLPEPIYRVRMDDASARTSAKPAQVAAETMAIGDLPSAADPRRVEDASSEAAERERDASDADENLLSDAQKGE